MSRIGDALKSAFRKNAPETVNDEPVAATPKSDLPTFNDTLASQTIGSEYNPELAKLAAYNCLANMVANNRFHDDPSKVIAKHPEESRIKGMHRLQVEDAFVDYGHGREVPVTDEEIRVYREIQGAMNGVALDNKGTDLLNVLSKGGKNIVAKVIDEFKKGQHSFVEFNSYYDAPLAKDFIHNIIKKEIASYIEKEKQSQR